MTRPYDILLLDADNTLLDFSRSEKNALDITFRHYGLTITDEIRALYHTINRGLWAAFERGEISKETITATRFSRLFAETGHAVDGTAFSRDYQKTLGEGYDLIDGAKALCEALAGKYRLYCVTSGSHPVQPPCTQRSGYLFRRHLRLGNHRPPETRHRLLPRRIQRHPALFPRQNPDRRRLAHFRHPERQKRGHRNLLV